MLPETAEAPVQPLTTWTQKSQAPCALGGGVVLLPHKCPHTVALWLQVWNVRFICSMSSLDLVILSFHVLSVLHNFVSAPSVANKPSKNQVEGMGKR